MKIIKTSLGWELRFWNEITNKIGMIISLKGFRCKKCGKIIEGKCIKYSKSFDIYHPECIEIDNSVENPLDYPYRARAICDNCKTGFLVGSNSEEFDKYYSCPVCESGAKCLAFQCYFKPIKEKK